MISHRDSYRPDIDGLRAIAVLSVAMFHSGLPFPGGFVGVDIFFVISGFLITGMLASEFVNTGRINFAGFYARRVRRLMPAFALVMLATLSISALLMFPQELPRLGKSAIAAVLLTANIHFLNFSGGYFDPSTDLMPLLHTWTLSVEEQYYLAWPLLIVLACKLPFAKRKPESRVRALLWTILVLSLAANLFMTSQHQPSAFYLTPYRAWEFALGGLISQFQSGLAKLSSLSGDGLFSVGLFGVIFSLFWIDDVAAYPGSLALIPTIGAAAIIAGGSVYSAKFPRTVLGVKPLVWIGLVSYPWYLWHWPLLSLARAYSLGVRDTFRDTGIVLGALVLAALTYHLVERPIRFRRPHFLPSVRATLWAGIGATVVVGFTASAIIEFGKWKQTRSIDQALAASDLGAAVRLAKCQPGNSIEVGDCSFGAQASPLEIVAWGDSHAEQLSPALSHYANQSNLRVLVRVFPTCPPLLGAVPVKRNEALLACGKQNDLVIDEIRQLVKQGNAKGVILGGRWNDYLGEQGTDPGEMLSWALADDWKNLRGVTQRFRLGEAPLDHAGSVATLTRSLRRTLLALSALDIRVLILAPVPELYFNGPQCLYLRSSAECTVPRAKVEARRHATMGSIQEASTGLANVRIFDPIGHFCDKSKCYTEQGGVIFYTDHDHVSPKKALTLLGDLEPYLLWMADSRNTSDADARNRTAVGREKP